MTQQPFEISIISDVDEFRRLEQDWNALALHNPLLSWDWMFSWWEAFRNGNDLIIIVVKDSQQKIIGIVPWYKTITRSGARVIRALGNGDACTDYFSIICPTHLRDQIEQHVAESIFSSSSLQRRMSRWDWIEIDGHSSESFDTFLSAMSRRGCRTHQQKLESSWVTDLLGPFEEFEATLKRSFRRKTRKAHKNLTNPRVSFDLIQKVEALEESWGSFCRLHQLRRKLLGQSGCFAEPQFEQFLLNTTKRLMQNNRAGLGRAQVDGKDIGFVLVFYSDKTCWKYQSGMDPQASSWEPGHLMTTALIEHAIESGYEKYDFLRGNESYKRFWNSQEQQLLKTRVVAPRSTSRFRHNLWLAGKNLKQSLVALRPTGVTENSPTH